jgi:hypothetical protein
MLPTPEERFHETLAAIFRDFLSSVRLLLEQKERRVSEADASADERNRLEEVTALRQIANRLEAITAQQNSNHQQRERQYWGWSLFVQVLLFLATTGAFGAAIWYASIARNQKTTMDGQLTAMNNSFAEIQKQTGPIKDSAKAATDGAKAAQQSANVARDALTRGQRAFVSFAQRWDMGSVAAPSDEQHVAIWEFRPVLINSGETPTRSLIHRVNWAASQTPLGADFDFRDSVGGPPSVLFGLAPKDTRTGGNCQIPVAVLNQIRIHTTHLYFWGWARYQDVFAGTPEHITMFCMEVADVRSDPTVVNTPLALIGGQCSTRHNCSDEECNGEHYGDGLVWRSPK